MRHHGETAPTAAGAIAPAAGTPPAPSDWATLHRLLPYLWQYKWRVIAAIVFMVGAKVANVGVPILLKTLVDAMSLKPGDPTALLVVPVGLLVAYGALRLSTSLFTELRELVFAKATQGASRAIALSTFEHLHENVAAVTEDAGNAVFRIMGAGLHQDGLDHFRGKWLSGAAGVKQTDEHA